MNITLIKKLLFSHILATNINMALISCLTAFFLFFLAFEGQGQEGNENFFSPKEGRIKVLSLESEKIWSQLLRPESLVQKDRLMEEFSEKQNEIVKILKNVADSDMTDLKGKDFIDFKRAVYKILFISQTKGYEDYKKNIKPIISHSSKEAKEFVVADSLRLLELIKEVQRVLFAQIYQSAPTLEESRLIKALEEEIKSSIKKIQKRKERGPLESLTHSLKEFINLSQKQGSSNHSCP